MDFNEVEMALELHIEQGPVMESEKLQIGIVDTVFGMHVLEVLYSGLGNHAGASPMKGRRDPMSAFAEAALAIEKTAVEMGHGVVATIGKMTVSPGGSNVIPDSVKFTIDIRSGSDVYIKEATERIRSLCADIAEKRTVTCEVRDVADSAAIPLSRKVIAQMQTLAEEQERLFKVMDSGAVHDTAMLAPYTEAGMIFVPSINGRSHVPEENTDETDLIRGAQFLMDYVEGGRK
jgi:allantoate deiminase